MTCFGLVWSAIQIMQTGLTCLEGQLVFDVITYTLTLFLSVDMALCDGLASDVVFLQHWQWSLGVICLFWSWISFIHKLMDLAHLGVFVLMIYEVIWTFGKVVVVILPFVASFGLVFYTMLRWAADTPFMSDTFMLKTFVMTLGEIDYDAIMSTIEGSEAFFTKFDNFVIIALFLLFLIVMPIIVINLLLGLAVGDIEKIRNVAGTKDLKAKALSSLSFAYQMPLCLQKKAKEYFQDFQLSSNVIIKVNHDN